MRTLLPGYPAVMSKLGDARVVHDYPVAPRRAGADPRRRGRGARAPRPRRPPLYDRPGGPYGDPSGADYPDNWRRFGALGRAAVDIAMASCPSSCRTSCMPTTGRPGSSPAYLRFYGVAAAVGDDDPQHRLPGLVSRRRLRRAGAAAAGRRPRRRRIFRRRRLPEGRARQRQRHHHRQPDLRRGDQDPGLRHGARRADRRPRRRAARHRQRHRHRGLEPRDRPAARRALFAEEAPGPRQKPRRGRGALRPAIPTMPRSSSWSAG